jgi:UDP-glucuronate decarboxylase
MYGRKTVLVTGGAGFLGSHLCDRLIAEGAHVMCVDNFYTGTHDNVAHLIGNPHFELIRHDVTVSFYADAHVAINMLDLARSVRTRIFQASTSESDNDLQVHPEPDICCQGEGEFNCALFPGIDWPLAVSTFAERS